MDELNRNQYVKLYSNETKNDLEVDSDLKSLFNVFDTNSELKTRKTTALELYLKETQWKIPKTFISSLDPLLAEQIRPGLITEITGAPGTGKTQLCFYLSLGIEGGTFIISTNKNFAPHRLRALATRFFENPRQALERIHILEASNCDEIYQKLRTLDDFFAAKKISLIIIDSIAWPLRQELPVKRTAQFFVLAQLLRSIAIRNNCSVVLTNDLTFTGNNEKSSSFGASFYHNINNRIFLYKEDDLTRRAKLLKSAISNSNKDVVFTII